MRGSNIQSVT